jgi:hypothetical protein
MHSPSFSTDASNEIDALKKSSDSKKQKSQQLVRASFCIKDAPQVRPTLLLIDKDKTTIEQIKEELRQRF